MNVPNITQSLGSAPTPLRTDAVAAAAPGSSRAASSGAPPLGVTSRTISFARLAWFDANDDGEIDTRPAAAGSDATLLVPSHSADLPEYTRSVTPLGAPAHAPGAHEFGGVRGANAARTNRAVDAYQRYGQTAVPPPVASTAPPTRTTPPVAAAAAPLALPASSTAAGADRTVS